MLKREVMAMREQSTEHLELSSQASLAVLAQPNIKPGSSLGIIAGGGGLPLAVAEAAKAAGHKVFIVGFRGSACSDIEKFPHAYVRMVELGRMLHYLRQAGCEYLVLVGALKRPRILDLRIDFGAVSRARSLLRLLKGGDDTVLRRVARLFEGEGFKVCAAHDFAPQLLAPEGCFSAHKPDEAHKGDIGLGLQVVKALGAFDIGQGAVISRGYVLGVEAAEGTDALLRRCGDLNKWGFSGRKGVLVKAPKPGQDLRLDMPTIGPRTVQMAAEAGLAGIAVAAGAVLLAEQEELVEKANQHGLFLYGVRLEEISASYSISPMERLTDETA